MPPKVWGAIHNAFGDVWWDGTNNSGGVITPPDTDSWYDGALSVTRAWMAGGSDGHRHFHVAVDSTGQWWVSVFNRTMTALLDRWEITGWVSDLPGPGAYVEGFLDIQHLCANNTRVVVIADHIDVALNHDSVDVTVFDPTGTILDQWPVATPLYSASLGQDTGSCTDGSFVYFAWTNDAGDDSIAKVNLSTGALADLFTVASVDAQVPSAIFGTGIGRGIVEIDGDLIIAGTYGVARIRQDGTVVWWGDITDPLSEYRSLAHSGNGSVWTSFDALAQADEWAYDGVLRRSISIPEETIHGWLGPSTIPPLRQRQRDDGALALGGRLAANTKNISTSRQASIRQGGRGTYF